MSVHLASAENEGRPKEVPNTEAEPMSRDRRPQLSHRCWGGDDDDDKAITSRDDEEIHNKDRTYHTATIGRMRVIIAKLMMFTRKTMG